MNARHVLSCLTIAALLGAAAPAYAQKPPPAHSPDADRLFREGRAAFDKGDYASACPKFEESERLEPAPGTLLNLALCEEQIGHVVRAREHFDLAASGFRPGDPRRALAQDHASKSEKRIAHLTLRLAPSAPAGAAVRVDGAPLDASALGHAREQDPHTAKIVVTAAGRADRAYDVKLDDGAAVEQTLDAGDALPEKSVQPTPIEPQPETREVPTPAPAAKPFPRKTIGFVVGGVGVASLAVGAVTGLMAMNRASTVKDHCDASYACDQQGIDAASDGSTFSTISTVTLAAGVVLTGVGAYFLFIARDPAPAPTTAFVPYVGPGGAGAAFVRSF